jgi:hypothetical protein
MLLIQDSPDQNPANATTALGGWMPSRRFAAILMGYFLLMLLPEWYPSVRASPLALLYQFSLVISIGFLLLLLVAGSSTALLAARGSRVRRRCQRLLALAGWGLLCFGTSWLLLVAVQRGLPYGSHILSFDRKVWLDSESTQAPVGHITERQRMLASVLGLLEPGKSRADIEELLGPSLQTGYFLEGGRDLIYYLGMERSSFLRLDSEWILIWIDDQGGLSRYRLATD